MDAERGFVVYVSTRVLTVTHSASLFRTLSLPEITSFSSLYEQAHICVRVRMYKCVNILCVYLQAVEIWNTLALRNKTSA